MAAQVGGIGIAPGANLMIVLVYLKQRMVQHQLMQKDKVNPSSLILSAEMMLRYMGWNEAADYVISGLESAIQGKFVTYDFARMMIMLLSYHVQSRQ